MQEIYSFKLISGEEIVTKISEKKDDGSYMIDSPMVLMLTEIEVATGKVQVMPMPVAPWVLLAERGIDILLQDKDIMWTNTNVHKMVEDAYLQSTTTIALK